MTGGEVTVREAVEAGLGDSAKGMEMEQKVVPGIFMVVLGLVGGIGILLAKADAASVDSASRIVPWARLFRCRWFRYLAASFCFLLSAVSLVWVIGWIG